MHRWYVVNTHSGFEKKVAQSIEEQAQKKGIIDNFKKVLVPLEEITELRNCLLYTSPSPRDGLLSRMPSSA